MFLMYKILVLTCLHGSVLRYYFAKIIITINDCDGDYSGNGNTNKSNSKYDR